MSDDFLNLLENEDIDTITASVGGIAVTVEQDTYDVEVTMTLTRTDTKESYIRRGVKEIFYDNWVDTIWYSWNIVL
jgi:hypothetical protein